MAGQSAVGCESLAAVEAARQPTGGTRVADLVGSQNHLLQLLSKPVSSGRKTSAELRADTEAVKTKLKLVSTFSLHLCV